MNGQTRLERLLFIAFMLLAFTVQTFVTQTHIHATAYGAPTALHLTDGPAKPGNLPSNDDSTNCPLCKEILQSGHFVGTAWLVFSLPAQAASSLEPVAALRPATSHAAFRWHSRAPPRG